MKVLYDYQVYYSQNFGGVSNAFTQLIKNLPEEIEYELALCESDNIHLRESGLKEVPPLDLVEDNFISRKKFKGRGFLFRNYSSLFPGQTSLGRNRRCSINALKRGDFDIFHPTFYEDYFLSYLNRKPFVLTVHDMISELFWNNRKNDIQIENKYKLCQNAAHIIAVSENTKKDLIQLFNVPEQKVTVIYHGAPEKKPLSSRSLINGRYFLYVGQRALYKFFNEMLINLAPVFEKHQDVKLVCTGPVFTKDELKMIHALKVEDKVIHIHPSDIDMFNLYSYALCFIYPSVYEGFGIPILEAYQAECPVLLNHKSCFPEIAQDAAIYFNLDEQQSNLAEVTEKFLSMSENERKNLIARQNERMNFFSWRKSAKKMAEVYSSLL